MKSGAIVGKSVETAIGLLGPVSLWRHGEPVDLPSSRKVRALLAYLAMASRPVSRSHLCELLWDVPNDPRGELRWCLSKLRRLLDTPGHQRVMTRDDLVWLALDDCALDVAALAEADAETDWRGEFAEGLVLDRSPGFSAWLAGQRRQALAAYVALIRQRLPSAGPKDQLHLLERWTRAAPFDEEGQVQFLCQLRRSGDIAGAEAHLRSVDALFAAEGLDPAPLHAAMRTLPARAQSPLAVPPPIPPQRQRATIAIMPFAGEGAGGFAGLAAGLTQDIITRLARLRSLFVIARGSVYALAEGGLDPLAAAQKLGVDYVATGTARLAPQGVTVGVELIEVGSGRVLWAEHFERGRQQAISVLDDICDAVVCAIASEVETAERNLAVLRHPNSLNAWQAYHRGLWHMYRFTRTENETARHFFQMAVDLDPTFSRAYSGLSFTHWQSAFQHWGDRGLDRELAYASASESLIADEHDPSAHWAMGRALWMRGSSDTAFAELARAVDLSPNFALGHYALAFVQSQSGNAEVAIGAADHSRRLSPFDPMLFGMLASRALAHVRLGRFEQAADWALRAAARPNAHTTILAIAAFCLALAGRMEEARLMMGTIRMRIPNYTIGDFLAAFRFSPDAASQFRHADRLIGATDARPGIRPPENSRR